MQFIEVSKARSMPGLRLVLARGQWAVWTEFAKNIMHVKGIPYIAVEQEGFGENAELVSWTGVRNQPQAVLNDEPVRTGWLEILHLAERLAPEPRLLPADCADRARVVGLSNEICGEWGIAWCRRVQIAAQFSFGEAGDRMMQANYGKGQADADAAERRIAETVRTLAKELHEQRAAGSRYFSGQSLSALDIYWACTSNLLAPLSQQECPLGPDLYRLFGEVGPEIASALDPVLIEHRDHIYRNHLIYPVNFG